MHRLSVATLAGIVLGIAGAVLADLYLEERVPILGDFAGLQYSLNPGIAFGITLPALFQSILILLALCMVTLLALMKAHTHLARWGFGLVIGGGLANVVDRFRDGYVTDYFQVGSFPIFNTADSCVTIGVGLLLLDVFLSERALRKKR